MDDTGLASTMRAVVVDHGAPERLVIADAPTPVPGPAEAMVRVRAFSLNRGETRMAISEPRPVGDRAGMWLG